MLHVHVHVVIWVIWKTSL